MSTLLCTASHTYGNASTFVTNVFKPDVGGAGVLLDGTAFVSSLTRSSRADPSPEAVHTDVPLEL